MNVNKNKIFYDYNIWKDIKTLPDGSMILVCYKEYKPNGELLELAESYNNSYKLNINIPQARDMLACIVIMRSSANCYKLSYTDNKLSDITTLTGLATVNEYIERAQRNLTQELNKSRYSEAQAKFAAAFPDKAIDSAFPPAYDIDKVIQAVKQSNFLRTAKNITLASCIKLYDKIIAGAYKDFDNGAAKQDYTQRDYDKDELNNSYDDISAYEL